MAMSTVRPFMADFLERRKEVRRYLHAAWQLEKRAEGDLGQSDRLHIVKAGAILVLYNLVESSIRGAIEAIQDELKTERVPFYEMSMPLRAKVIDDFRRYKGKKELLHRVVDPAVDIVHVAWPTKAIFEKNLDAKILKEIADEYGFSVETDAQRTGNGQLLNDLVAKRIDLAHGHKSYDQVGRSLTSKSLLAYYLETTRFIESILDNVTAYLDQKAYLAKDGDLRTPLADQVPLAAVFEMT